MTVKTKSPEPTHSRRQGMERETEMKHESQNFIQIIRFPDSLCSSVSTNTFLLWMGLSLRPEPHLPGVPVSLSARAGPRVAFRDWLHSSTHVPVFIHSQTHMQVVLGGIGQPPPRFLIVSRIPSHLLVPVFRPCQPGCHQAHGSSHGAGNLACGFLTHPKGYYTQIAGPTPSFSASRSAAAGGVQGRNAAGLGTTVSTAL